MVKDIGERRNTYDDPETPPEIVLNSTSFIKIFDADEARIGYEATVMSNTTIFVLEKDPGGDHTNRGKPVFGRQSYESSDSRIPTGEIWAKSLNGTPSVFFQQE